MEWEKIFTNDMTNKGLIPNIYKQLIRLKIKKTNNLIKKMGRRPEETFSQRRHIDAQQAHEKMLNIINHQTNANQTTMRYHLTPTRMAVIKKTTNNKCW